MRRNFLNELAGALGITQASYPNDSKLEQKILYALKNRTAFAGALATGTLTSDNTNVSNNDTVTIGSQTYTFKTALTAATTANEVLIGADADTSLTNLRSAINGTGTAGTDYGSMTPVNTSVTCGAVIAHVVIVTAVDYAITNGSIATTETSSHLSWGAATLASGTPKIVAPGTTTISGAPGLSGDKNV